MTKETSQPLSEQSSRNPADQELVGKVLGTEAAADMEELVGDQTVTESHPTPQQIELSADELSALQQEDSQEHVEPIIRREQYIEWMKEELGTAISVDQHFNFLPNGDVEVKGGLDFGHITISSWPPALKKVNGFFIMNDTTWNLPLDFLKKLEVTDEIEIDVSMIDNFPSRVVCKQVVIKFVDKPTEKDANEAVNKLEKKGYTKIQTSIPFDKL